MSQSRSLLIPYLLILGLCVALQGALYGVGVTPAAEGQLIGTDGYTRLVRVAELSATWDWHDDTLERIDPPNGLSFHWTRPFDLLLLVGAAALAPLLGFDQSLYVSGIWISPVLHAVMLMALIWATAPILSPWRRFLAALAGLAHVGVLVYSLAGRADHHMLVLIVFVATLGVTLRLILRPFDPRLAFAAGAVLGAGLWVSMEFLLMLAVTLGALAVIWMLRGGDSARRNLWHALGLTAAIALALVVERPPAGYMAEEYDRISIVHLLIALLGYSLWAGVMVAEGRGVNLRARMPRSAAVVIGGLLAGGALLMIYPRFYGGPTIDVDPRLDVAIMARIKELEPLLPTDLHSFGRFLVYLGPITVTTPFLGFILWCERDQRAWPAWLYVALLTAAFLPVALSMMRAAPYMGLLMAVPLAELLGRTMTAAVRFVRLPASRFLLRAGLSVGFILGFVLIGAPLSESGAKPARQPCALDAVITVLNQPGGLGARPRVILAHFDYGPEILYRTDHAVIAAPYHRNTAGILDSDRIFRSRDLDESRRLIAQRGAEVVLACTDPAAAEAGFGADGFFGALARGQAPAWLQAIDLPAGTASDFRIYRVGP